MREIVLDTETTGLNPFDGHRIVEIGCVEVINKIRTDKYLQLYINPERDMPVEAYNIHGISAEFLRDKPKFAEVKDLFIEFIADSPLVIHNAGFDMKFLNYELSFHKHKINNAVIDTLQMARLQFPGAKATLDALCKRFKIDISRRDKHGALLDSELLADVYMMLCGGSQTNMGIDLSSFEQKKAKSFSDKSRFKPRIFEVCSEEQIAHQEFMKNIKP